MNLDETQYCPETLATGFTTYSPTCLRSLFSGKKVTHVLPYDSPQQDEEVAQQFIENRKRISISGVQEKLSLLLEKNQLRLTNVGEQGTYILKPIPRDLIKVDQIPANEHLTMQIAKQVYGLNTAENAMIFFKNGTPAYITKRFDVKDTGGKWGKEYVAAWRVEIEKYFSLVVFNFLFSNGDAHLKNFSLLESHQGDYLLSPAYDLVNTRLHVDDADFALDKGLFADNYKSEEYKQSGYPSKNDFVELANRIGVVESRVQKLLQPLLDKQPLVATLAKHSFLNEANKRAYLLMYNTRRNFLNK